MSNKICCNLCGIVRHDHRVPGRGYGVREVVILMCVDGEEGEKEDGCFD